MTQWIIHFSRGITDGLTFVGIRKDGKKGLPLEDALPEEVAKFFEAEKIRNGYFKTMMSMEDLRRLGKVRRDGALHVYWKGDIP